MACFVVVEVGSGTCPKLVELLPLVPDGRLSLHNGHNLLCDSSNPRADGNDSTLGLVGFSIFPHLDSPDRTMAQAEQWAADIKGPAYATDSQTAIKVTDGSVEVISEGYWKLFNAAV